MTAREWERIKTLFDAALNVPPAERAAWLDAACSEWPELRETLKQLLETWDTSNGSSKAVEAHPVFSPGQVVANRFRILRLIARGGMGEVYEAQDAALNGLRVALKTIRSEIASERHAYERFKREVWVARELPDAGICRIYDLAEHRELAPDGTERVVPCLTMQLLEGRTLASVLATARPLSPEESLPLIRQVIDAIGVMHSKGIVHRDIKPSNIMLIDSSEGVRGRAVVMDFGLAKPLQGNAVLWDTHTVDRAGAPYFIAPEVLRGEKGGTAVDIYALGLVIDEMVTRSAAFPSESIEELYWKKLHTDAIPPSERCDSLPSSWEQTILRCLDRNPEQRPSTVAGILQGLLQAQPEATHITPAVVPGASPVGTRTPPARHYDSGVPVLHLSRRGWLGIGTGCVVLPAVAAVLGGGTPSLNTSMLVYPFTNLTRQPEHDAVCTGTADELMRRLIYIEGLRVFPVREARSRNAPGPDQAQFSLEGNLQHHEGRIRLTVQLIDNQTGALVWSDQFQHALDDPLALESEIAEKLMAALIQRMQERSAFGAQVAFATAPVRRLFGYGSSPLPSQATASSAAFAEYIRGRQLWQKRTLPETYQAIEHFERAVAADRGFALAYSALADAQHTLLTYNAGDTLQLLTAARHYAERAVALDPSKPEVHASLAAVQQMFWDWRGSEASYRAAIQTQPKFARAHLWFAGLLLLLGRFNEALTGARLGLELDPFDYAGQSAYGLYLWHAGRLREAAKHLEGMLAKTDFLYGHAVLGQVYAALAVSAAEPEATDLFVRSLREAGIVRTREFDAAGGNDNAGFLKWSDLVSVQAHAARGDRASAQIYIDRLEHGLRSDKLSASAVAWAHAAVGNYTRTLELLELGLARHEREMLNVKVTPLFRPLQNHPRFVAILRQMAL